MENLSYAVLKDFQISSSPIKKYKGAYIIKDKNPKIVYKTYYSQDNIIKASLISDILSKNKIKTTDKFYKTKNNKLTTFADGQYYVMNDFLNLNQNIFDDKIIFLQAIKEIAKFHKILKNINLDIEISENYKEEVIKNIHELDKLKKKVAKFPKKMDFDILFLNSYKYFYEDLENVYNMFSSSYFIENMNIAIREKHIVHGNIKEETIGQYNNNIYINNFYNSYIGTQLEDISKAIIKYLKNSQEVISFDEIIESYNSIIPLNVADIEIIKSFCIYPNKYIKILNDFYKKNRTWAPTSFNKNLEEEIDLRNKIKKTLIN